MSQAKGNVSNPAKSLIKLSLKHRLIPTLRNFETKSSRKNSIHVNITFDFAIPAQSHSILQRLLAFLANMRLTAELINNSLSYLNPLKERELDLRGMPHTKPRKIYPEKDRCYILTKS